jgi:hypothetical protein
MPKEEAGTLAWYRADLKARRTAFTKILKNPALSIEERAPWAERLADVEAVLADMDQDPLGYTTWLLAERNTAVRKQTDRFKQ